MSVKTQSVNAMSEWTYCQCSRCEGRSKGEGFSGTLGGPPLIGETSKVSKLPYGEWSASVEGGEDLGVPMGTRSIGEPSREPIYQGTFRDQPNGPREPNEEDRELWRLPAMWATSDPEEASQYGPNVHEVEIPMSNPYHVTLKPTPGDPGLEIAESLGIPHSEEPLDVAAELRNRGHDGVVINWTDGRVWHAGLPQRVATSWGLPRDTVVCPSCNEPSLSEPYQWQSGDWYQQCTTPGCHANFKLPSLHPLVQQHKNLYPQYPQMLNDVGQPRPWFQASRTATMTLPQEMRAWDKVKLISRRPSKSIYESPEGWSIHQHFDPHPVGAFMRNCWQDGMLQGDDSPYHALHDQNGLPRAAFYLEHPGQPLIADVWGMRNNFLHPTYAEQIAQFAQNQGAKIDSYPGVGETGIGVDPDLWLDSAREHYEDLYNPQAANPELYRQGKTDSADVADPHYGGVLDRLMPQSCPCGKRATGELTLSNGQWIPVCQQHAQTIIANPMAYLPYAKGEPKMAAMTLPQEQRYWEQLRQEHPETSEIVHQFPNGMTIQRHPDPDDCKRVGKFMRNCWQASGDPATGDAAYHDWIQQSNPHTLHDESGLPRIAFYLKGNEVQEPLGMRNAIPKQEHLEALANWAVPNGYQFPEEAKRWLEEYQIPLRQYTCPQCQGVMQGSAAWGLEPYCPNCDLYYSEAPQTPQLRDTLGEPYRA